MTHDDTSRLFTGGSSTMLPTTNPTNNLLLGSLVFLACATLVFGGWKILADTNGPFASKGDAKTASNVTTATDLAKSDSDRLKKIDTDSDGISDYDEINVFHTSPYLKDTDSDGIDDKTELMNGTDPNCPEGQNCFRTDTTTTAPTDTGPSATQQQAMGLQNVLNPTPAQLRSALKTGGMPASQVDQMSDTQLLDAYKKSLATTSQTPVAGGVDPAKLANPDSLTPAEIRQILLSTGKVTETQLQQVDDTTLKTQFIQSLKDAQATQATGTTTPAPAPTTTTPKK